MNEALFIILFCCNNKIFRIMVSSMDSNFYLQVLDISDLEVLNFWLYWSGF